MVSIKNKFVSSSSYGFSGNLGYVMPKDWAFDQFAVDLVIGSGAGKLSIDKVAVSGLDNGFNKLIDIDIEKEMIEFGTNKGVKIPVLKQEVFAKREPNLSNKEIEQPKEEKEKKGFLGLGKKKEESE